MLQSKSDQFPVSLKVSYDKQLQLRLCIPQKFQINRYCRHWVVIYGFNEFQEHQISKKYFSYLNEGDLIKIKSSSFKLNWKQKADTKIQAFDQIYNQNLKNFQTRQKKEKSPINTTNQLVNSIQTLEKIYCEDLKQQMSGMKIITLFLNIQSENQIIIKILELIEQKNNSNIMVNIFVNDPLLWFKGLFSFVDQWVEFHKNSSLDYQIKSIFYKLNKTTVKKINVNLKCFDGQLFRKDFLKRKQKVSNWNLNKNNLALEVNFPKCNRIYIHFIQFRNLGYQKQYQFQLDMTCLDNNERTFVTKKKFTLRPIRDEFQSITSPDYMAENQEKVRKVMRIDQSLTFQTMQMFDKVQNIKQICQKVQIQIKNNGKFDKNSKQQSNDLKMMHSFQI